MTTSGDHPHPTPEPSPPPLDGLVVADFSRVLAGPLATMTLADLGATVIKIERPGAGDDTRQWGPPWTTHSSAYFESVNRSKLSIALDLNDPTDRATAQAIAAHADVLVENFKTGALDKYQLGYAQVATSNPGLIYCSITGFGSRHGKDLPGYDFVVQAVGGLMSITGEPDQDPQKVGVALVDILTGKDAIIAILAALVERQRSGRGQHVEVNLLTSLLGSLANQTATTLTTGRAPNRKGNRHPSIAPYETLPCRDGMLAVSCGNDQQFRAMCQVLGVVAPPKLATNPGRVEHRGELRELLSQALTVGKVADWVAKLNAAGIAAGPVNDIAQGIAYAEALGLEPTVAVGADYPDQIRHPIDWSRSATRQPTPPPQLGADAEAVHAWLADLPAKSPDPAQGGAQ